MSEEKKWQDICSDYQCLKDAVFASGVPFPIFPPHVVKKVLDGVPVVDGGYTHNLPLHATQILGSRRVLVIRSSSPTLLYNSEGKSDRGSRLLAGQLVSYSNRILPFLFNRAQEVDRLGAGKMIVASLSPSIGDQGETFPPLTDFTRQAVEKIKKVAYRDIDIDARTGTFEHWGIPSFEDRIY